MELSKKRIQRKRTLGWKMPPSAKYVGRPTKFGNPFKLRGDMIYFDASYRRKILDKWVLFYDDGGHSIEEVVEIYNDLLFNPDSKKYDVENEIRDKFRIMRDSISELNGKNLACFCNVKQPCHCDPLLEFIKSKTKRESKLMVINPYIKSSEKAWKTIEELRQANQGKKILIFDPIPDEIFVP